MSDLINEAIVSAPLHQSDVRERLRKAAGRDDAAKDEVVASSDSVFTAEEKDAAVFSPLPPVSSAVVEDIFEGPLDSQERVEEELAELNRIIEENENRFDQLNQIISAQSINLISSQTGLEVEADGYGEILALKFEDLKFNPNFVRSLEKELVRLINEVDSRAREIEVSARKKLDGT
ncbi:hypothetical protein ACFVH6_36055 [Spirillospora sp. NPDC127200]